MSDKQIQCKHSLRDVYQDTQTMKFFAECNVCESQGALAEDAKQAVEKLLKVKATRPSRQGGYRENAGRPKELPEDVKCRALMLGDKHIETLDRFQLEYEKLTGEKLSGRSEGLRILTEKLRIKDMKELITR